MGDFSQPLSPGAFMGGVDFQGCFLHWLVRPACRGSLGDRHPVSVSISSFLFGLRPSPGWNHCCVKEVLRISRAEVPSSKIIDFAGDLRMAFVSGAHGELPVDMEKFKGRLGRLGVRDHTRGGKHWWLGFSADTNESVVRIEEEKVAKGMSRSQGISGLRPVSTKSARGPPSPVGRPRRFCLLLRGVERGQRFWNHGTEAFGRWSRGSSSVNHRGSA